MDDMREAMDAMDDFTANEYEYFLCEWEADQTGEPVGQIYKRRNHPAEDVCDGTLMFPTTGA
jgi:hypothetical protein